MSQNTLVVSTVLVLLALVPAFGVLWEIHNVPWNDGPYRRLGRVLFSKSAVIALVLMLSFIGGMLALFEYGRPFWFEVLRLFMFSLIVPVLWWQWYVYRKTRLSDDPTGGNQVEDDLSSHH